MAEISKFLTTCSSVKPCRHCYNSYL